MLTVYLDPISFALVALNRAALALGGVSPAAFAFAAIVGLVAFLGAKALRA
jgi:hypothetical protein